MGLTDKLKNLSKKAETLAVEHKDQIQSATQKAEQAIDKRTGGRYHDKIEQAGAKADGMLDRLEPTTPTQEPATSAAPDAAPVSPQTKREES